MHIAQDLDSPKRQILEISNRRADEIECARHDDSLARIIHECLGEAAETEAHRGFSQVRATQAYLRSVEEIEREKLA